MRDRDTPMRLIRAWEKMIPGIYSHMDELRSVRGSSPGMDWPDYCPLPIGAAFELLRTQEGLDVRQAAELCAEITACWAWKQAKIVYAYDPALAAALAAQAEDVRDTDVLPCEVLMHLPYPCIYIKAPGLLEHTDGFFAWIEYDINAQRPELRVQWLFEDMAHSFPQVLHLMPGEDLKTCILDTIHTTQENLGEDIPLQDVDVGVARIILSAVQLILYLVSDNADAEEAPSPPALAVHSGKLAAPRSAKSRDKASQVREIDVGVRIGAALRKAAKRSTGGGRSGAEPGAVKRSHTRRGHWHHYWTGPRDGERTLTLRWTAPTVIHPEDREDNVTLYPVR